MPTKLFLSLPLAVFLGLLCACTVHSLPMDEQNLTATTTYRFVADPNGFPISPNNLGYGVLEILAVSPGLLGNSF